MMRQNLSSAPLVQCQAIRVARRLLLSRELDTVAESTLVGYIRDSLAPSCHPMVSNEAAMAVCEIVKAREDLEESLLPKVWEQISAFVEAGSMVMAYTGLKLANMFAYASQEKAESLCTRLEGFLLCRNLGIVAMAVSVLAQVCKEQDAERLLMLVVEFAGRDEDTYKISFVQSAQYILKRFPDKALQVVEFLSRCKRQKGNKAFYSEILKELAEILRAFPSTRSLGVAAMLELLENCEFDSVKSKVRSSQTKHCDSALNFSLNSSLCSSQTKTWQCDACAGCWRRRTTACRPQS